MESNIKKIIKLRKEKKLSIKRFAEMLGVSTKTIYNWESGVSGFKKTDLLAMAHVLNVKLSDISEFKDLGFHYIKPGLHRSSSIHESTKHLKNMLSDNSCTDNAALLPLLHAEETITKLNIENIRLLERVHRYKHILDTLDIPVYIKNSKRTVTYINQAFLNILSEHLKEEDIVGHKFSEIFSHNQFSALLKLENKVFAAACQSSILTTISFIKLKTKQNVTAKALSIRNNIVKEIIVLLIPEKNTSI